MTMMQVLLGASIFNVSPISAMIEIPIYKKEPLEGETLVPRVFVPSEKIDLIAAEKANPGSSPFF